MPARRKAALTPERRAALSAELAMLGRQEEQATLDKYVHVSWAYDAGMTVREIAAVYDVTADTAKRWKDVGERERERRGRGDPERSREPEPNG